MASAYHGVLPFAFLGHLAVCSSSDHLSFLVPGKSLQKGFITWELGAAVLYWWHTTLGPHADIFSVCPLHHSAL